MTTPGCTPKVQALFHDLPPQDHPPLAGAAPVLPASGSGPAGRHPLARPAGSRRGAGCRHAGAGLQPGHLPLVQRQPAHPLVEYRPAHGAAPGKLPAAQVVAQVPAAFCRVTAVRNPHRHQLRGSHGSLRRPTHASGRHLDHGRRPASLHRTTSARSGAQRGNLDPWRACRRPVLRCPGQSGLR